MNREAPKRLLALDGGGIRGLITIEVLAAIERLLRREMRRDDSFVLGDYFDYVAGTSTGAIIAACIALGMSASEIREFYVEHGADMFQRAAWYERIFYKYRHQRLAATLRRVLKEKAQGSPGGDAKTGIGWTAEGDPTLGCPALRTLLMMVMRNATTDSPWPVSSNPRAKYNDSAREDCNLRIPLWRLVRASTAAPVFFPPEVVKVGPKEFVFVDGGVTTCNNPAFLLFLMATVQPYRLEWPVGEEKTLLVSVGTGTDPKANADLRPFKMNLVYNARSIPSALMYAALNEQDMLCRVFGKCRTGDPLDREIGDLRGARGPVTPRLFTYVRYNVELSQAGLTALGLPEIEPKNVQKLDSVQHVRDLQKVGEAVAAKKVEGAHFQGFV